MLNTPRLAASLAVVGFFLFVVRPVGAQVETLRSSALRVELNARPYSLRIIEQSTGQVLLAASRTAFADLSHRVASATDVEKKPDSLQANLILLGVSETAKLTLTLLKPEVLQVTLAYAGEECPSIYQEFEDHNEHYYGVWEYPFGGSIDNRGADADFVGTHQLPDVNFSNARAPFYLTSRRYGIYVESTALGHYDFSQSGRTSFSFQAKELTFDVIYGPSYAEVLNRYNAMAGPSAMPPTWAFGSIWWRDDAHDDLRGAANAQEKTIQDADRLRSLHIPASAIWLDRPYGTGEHGWGNMDFDGSFPSPEKMIRDLEDRGMHLLLWIANRCSNRLFERGSAKGYLFDDPWPAADLRRPEVYDWFQEQLNAYARLGVRGYKIDRGEEGELPRSLENVNAILFPKLAADGLRAAYGNDYFEFSRNANDTARKYTAIWNGDTRCTLGGLAASIKNALRAGAIDFPMWGSDTGGYIRVPDKQLFARWLEFSAFSPIMEVLIGPKRTIWDDYDSELVRIAQTYVSMHHDLIPYTRSYLYQATQTGMPVMRALIFAFPGDPSLSDTWDEYLFGRDILVAPVTTPGATARQVYLPSGRWMNYNDRSSIYKGPASISAEASLATLPLFVREGAIIPRGDILKANNNWEMPWTPKLRIEIFPSTKDASDFAYYTGDGVQTIRVNPVQGGIEVHLEDLGVSGSVELYCHGVQQVQRNGKPLKEGADYRYDAQKKKLTISFSGASTFFVPGASGPFGVSTPR